MRQVGEAPEPAQGAWQEIVMFVRIVDFRLSVSTTKRNHHGTDVGQIDSFWLSNVMFRFSLSNIWVDSVGV